MERSNIEMQRDNARYVIFRTTCDCGMDNHSIKVIVDEKHGTPIVSMFYECGWRDGWKLRWWKVLMERLKAASSILFKGRLCLDEEFIFRSGEHLEDFLKTLKQAVEQVKDGWERSQKTSEENS